MPGFKLIPVGEMQGRVAVEVDVSQVDLDDDVDLTQHVLRALVPGAAAIELTNAPWGANQLDRALMMLQADGRTSELEVWAYRPVTETRWASVPVWWVFDASSLFASGIEAPALVDAINVLPFLPEPAEVVLKGAHEQAISHVLLDELATRLDPGISWLYLDPQTKAWETAKREVARCATPWGLRELR